MYLRQINTEVGFTHHYYNRVALGVKHLKYLSHGFVVDGKGHKMSKSAGNTISPEEILKKYGADILRIWVAA